MLPQNRFFRFSPLVLFTWAACGGGETSSSTVDFDAAIMMSPDASPVKDCVATNSITLEHSFRGALQAPNMAYYGFFMGNWRVTGGSWQLRAVRWDETLQLPDYWTGTILSGVLPASRAYHTFDVSSVMGTIVTARMEMSYPENSYDSPDSSETIGLFSVSSQSETLEAITSTMNTDVKAIREQLAPVFTDLGNGVSYGQFEATEAKVGTLESVNLNAAALEDLNSSDGLWTVGLDMVSIGGAEVMERVFRGTAQKNPTRLVLEVCL